MALPAPRPGRTALVTGASSGIGRAIAGQLARRGHDLTLVARRGDALDRVADRLRPLTTVTTVVADLSDPGDRDDLLAGLATRGVEVDVLVNCAGTGPLGPVADTPPNLATVRINVEALVDLTARIVPGMVARGRGAILQVASTGGFMPVPGQAVYSGTKAFVITHSQALHEELAGTGVAVTVLCPGPVRTGFASAAGTTDGHLFAGLPESMIETADEVARAGVDGLDRNRRVVVPGLLNRVMAAFSVHTPRRLLMPVLARGGPGMRAGSAAPATRSPDSPRS